MEIMANLTCLSYEPEYFKEKVRQKNPQNFITAPYRAGTKWLCPKTNQPLHWCRDLLGSPHQNHTPPIGKPTLFQQDFPSSPIFPYTNTMTKTYHYSGLVVNPSSLKLTFIKANGIFWKVDSESQSACGKEIITESTVLHFNSCITEIQFKFVNNKSTMGWEFKI